jgi:hypothetical protein
MLRQPDLQVFGMPNVIAAIAAPQEVNVKGHGLRLNGTAEPAKRVPRSQGKNSAQAELVEAGLVSANPGQKESGRHEVGPL